MPVFYFDIAHNGKIEEDYDGKVLQDLDTARAVAALTVAGPLERTQKRMIGAIIQICDG